MADLRDSKPAGFFSWPTFNTQKILPLLVILTGVLLLLTLANAFILWQVAGRLPTTSINPASVNISNPSGLGWNPNAVAPNAALSERLNNSLAGVRAAAQRLNSSAPLSDLERAQLTEALEQLAAQLQAEQADADRLINQSRTDNQTIQSLRADLAGTEENLTQLQANLSSQNAQITRLTIDLTTTQESLNATMNEVGSKNVILQNQSVMIEKLKTQIEDLRSRINDLASLIP